MHEDETEELVSEVYITLNTKTYAYSSSSSKYEATMKTPDWVNIVIYVTLVEGYTYSENAKWTDKTTRYHHKSRKHGSNIKITSKIKFN